MSYDDTVQVPTTPKEVIHVEHPARPRTGRTRGLLNLRRIRRKADRAHSTQEAVGHGRKDDTDASREATLRHARHRHKRLARVRQNFIDAQAGLRRLAPYIVLSLATIAALMAAYAFPHAPAWQGTLLALLSILLTVFSSPVTVKMLLFLMIAPWHGLWLLVHQQKRDTAYAPLVSVLIPAYNEAVGLVPTIKTVLASTYRHIEILVINDGSTDTSDAVMHTFLAKYRVAMRGVPGAIPILYHYQQNAGKAVALNTGIGLSHGDIIVSLDADCVLDKDCIAAFVDTMRDDRIMAVCGNVKVGNPGSVLALIQLFEYAASFYARQADALLNTLYVISGAAGAYRRSVFDDIGTYGTNLRGGGEDVDLSIRVQKAGYRIAYCADAIVYTEVPTTFNSLLKQRKRWTYSRFMTFKRYNSMIFSRQKEHNKVLTWLVMPLIIFNDWLYIVKMLLKIGLYVVALVTGSYQVLAMLVLLSMVITAIPLVQDRQYRAYILLSPLAWILSFVSAFIEMLASASAIRNMLGKREVTWGVQQRQGAVSSLRK